MTEKIKITIMDPGGDGKPARIGLKVLDRELVGKRATLTLTTEVKVSDRSPVNESKQLYRTSFTISSDKLISERKIPAKHLQQYSYDGNKIDIVMHVQVEIDDGLLFDAKISQKMDRSLGDKPKVSDDSSSIIEPKDIFRFFANLKAIPFHNQVLTLLLVVVGGIVMLINAAIGIHDQFVPESMTWLYSHYESDGDSSSPLVNALAGSGALGAFVWYLMKGQLRKYMRFHLSTNLPSYFEPGKDYKVAQLFGGRSRVPLQDIALRIVASNMECGQYRRRSGSTTRTISFKEPVRGVVLYEKQIDHIPANMPINQYFSGERMCFDDMFRVLYPRNMISKTHGLDIYWEIQLIHPDYVDHELAGPASHFRYRDFLQDKLEFDLG